MNPGVYFEFKPYLNKATGEPIYLKDIINYTSPGKLKEKLDNVAIFPQGIQKSTSVSAIQVIALINQQLNGEPVNLVGHSSALFEPRQIHSQNTVISFIKVAFAVILLFIGSGLAIMYFHSDVNMHQAHQSIYYLISGEKVDRPLILSISYSIGIGLGIALFFDIFAIGRKKQNPGPLELELYQNEKELEDYLVNLKGKREGE